MPVDLSDTAMRIANDAGLYQSPQNAASDLVLHCFDKSVYANTIEYFVSDSYANVY